MHDHFNEVGSVCECGVPILKNKGFDGNGLCEYLLHPSYKPCLYSESRVISLALRVPLKIMSTKNILLLLIMKTSDLCYP